MTRKIFIFEILLIAAALVAICVAWPHLPTLVTAHWNWQGQPDRMGPRWWIALMGPGFMALIAALTWMLPWLSPKKFKIEAFLSTYQQIMLMVFCMAAYIFAAQIWTALGPPTDAGRVILGGACVFITLIGNVMGKVRRNFFVGVRTPWTLASERVWNATHRFAGRTFVAGGLAGLALSLLGLRGCTVSVLVAAGLASVVYSLVYYKKLERRGELNGGPLHEQGEL